MTETEKNNLITLLRTCSRATLLMEALSDTLDDTYKVKKPLLEILKKSLSLDLQTDLLSFFSSEKIGVLKKDNFLHIAQEIVEAIPTLPRVSITIAIQPNYLVETFLSREIAKIQKNPLLLDIHYNPDILGGAIIQRNGLYKDYSIQKMFRHL